MENFEYIKQLIKLVVDNKLDQLQVGDVFIQKTRYDVPKKASQEITSQEIASVQTPEELIFWSSGGTPILSDLEKDLIKQVNKNKGQK